MGEYQLETTKDNKIRHSFSFKKMKIIEFKNLLKEQKIQSLFQPIYDIVMELFVDKHNEIILPEKPHWILAKHEFKPNVL